MLNVVLMNGIADMDEDLIDARIEIRKLIERGSIEEAINRINNLNSEVRCPLSIS